MKDRISVEELQRRIEPTEENGTRLVNTANEVEQVLLKHGLSRTEGLIVLTYVIVAQFATADEDVVIEKFAGSLRAGFAGKREMEGERS